MSTVIESGTVMTAELSARGPLPVALPVRAARLVRTFALDVVLAAVALLTFVRPELLHVPALGGAGAALLIAAVVVLRRRPRAHTCTSH